VAVDVPGFTVTTDKPSVTITSVGQEVPVAFTFTRTDAPLTQFAKGFVTLTGPTRVRMPVALRPVALKSPATVAGTGADGRVAEVTPGYSGAQDIAPSGLAKATTVEKSLAVGETLERDVPIAAGTKVTRFVVGGYDAAPGETTIGTTYDEYLLDATATFGSFKADSDPLTVEQGRTTSYDAVWTSLEAGRYLGLMEYSTSPTPTYVTGSVP
jgi:hypothetical protein